MASWAILLLCVLSFKQMVTLFGEGKVHFSDNPEIYDSGSTAAQAVQVKISGTSSQRPEGEKFAPAVADRHKALLTWDANEGKGNHRRHFDRNSTRSMAWNTVGHEYAVVYENEDGANYRGVKATIGIWEPYVEEQMGMSLAQLWVQSGDGDSMNSVEVGWQILPRRFSGEYTPHLFVCTTNDSFHQFVCYDTDCHDTFIKTDHGEDDVLGEPIQPSVIGGDRRETEFILQMDSHGNWHVFVGGYHVGYWPARVLPRLSRGGEKVTWGGEIYTITKAGKKHTSTEMGSGRFPSEGAGKAAHFLNLRYVKGNRNSFVSPSCSSLRLYRTNKNCYDLQCGEIDGNTYFYYGGPGYNPKCKRAL